MKNKFLISEGLTILVMIMFTWCVYQYSHTGSKIIFFFESMWFIIIFGVVWYGMYKRLESMEVTKPKKNVT